MLVVVGWATFLRGNVDRHFDIDFTGGNMVQVTFDEAMTNAEVLAELEAAGADPEKLDMLDPSAIQLQPYFAEFGVGGGASRQWSFRARDPQAREIEAASQRLSASSADGRQEIDRMVAEERPARPKSPLPAARCAVSKIGLM